METVTRHLLSAIDALLPALEHFRLLGYWAVLLFSLLESLAFVGVVVPGALFVVFAGSLASKGYFDIGDLVWFAVVGAVLGDGISFRMGRGGHIRFREENRIFRPGLLEKGREFFAAHGGKSIFLGRFVGLIRAVIPFVAGMSGMEARTFYLWNIASAVVWAASHLLAGYFLGEAWRAVEVWSSRMGAVLAAMLLLALAALLLKRFLEKRGKALVEFAGSLLAAARAAIAADPRVRKFVEKHPSFFAFAAKRLDATTFSGLPFTLLGVVFLYVLLLLAGVIEDVLTLDPIVALDSRIENLLYAFRDPATARFFLWVTLLAKTQVVLCVALLLVAVFLLRKQREFVLPLLVTVAGSGLFDFLGKIAIHRQRPLGVGAYAETSFSFPSGHSAVAAAIYGFAAYYMWRRATTRGSRLNILFAVTFLVAAIGFSRLYLGVHYLSDVLGGYLLGILWLIIGICIAELRVRGEHPPGAPAPSPAAEKWAPAGLLLACAVFYVLSGLRYHPPAYFPPVPAATVVEEADLLKEIGRALPKYTENLAGDRQQPLSVVIVTPDEEALAGAFARAGWVKSDPLRVGTAMKMGEALVSNRSYPAGPVAPSFWDRRVNDLSFEEETPARTIRQRRLARLWKTDLRTPGGRAVYAGTVAFDTGLKWMVLYRIGPDIDAEREELLRKLLAAGTVASFGRNAFVPPMSGRNSFGDPYFTDGRVATISLR